jgi:hypothetical protein
MLQNFEARGSSVPLENFGVPPSSTSCRSNQVRISSRLARPFRFFSTIKPGVLASRQPRLITKAFQTRICS